jgi:hypothetical protein
MKLGTKRHVQIQKEGDFIDWADVAHIAERLLPHGPHNYTAQALSVFIELDGEKSKGHD